MANIGLQNPHYAIQTKDDATGLTYSAQKRLAAAVSASITPNVSTSTFYADDAAAATNSALSSIEVKLEIDGLEASVVNELLGVQKNADGVMEYTGEQNAPYVALSFRSALSKGGYQYITLLKGKFNIPESSFQTKGESVEYQTTTITGTFLVTEFNDMWKVEVNSNDIEVGKEAIIENWFTTVYTGVTAA
ncbi:phage tail protein [Peribacillus frigoritolerans]|uniref:major tail protein n=1 Tax=Peribacillus frigoritolerans TaxID=450367 RepID=UPI00207966F0|nr:major tail protein [Peribacillus frigoritolerans]USK78957.1 phage tail protein [Peribacillus frigoritolerans]